MFASHVTRKREWLLTAIFLTVFSGFFVLQPAFDAMGQAGKSKPSPTAALKPDLLADIKLAIQLVEKNDFRAFIEQYAPVEALRELRQMEPADRSKETVATFSIPSADKQSKRKIRFQLVDSHWRLYDDSPRVVKELTRQANLKPVSAIQVIPMERIGSNWRFIDLPLLQGNEQ
jgi:hypothetical protein